MKKMFYLLFVVIAVFSIVNVSAQTATVTWTCVAADSQTAIVSGNVVGLSSLGMNMKVKDYDGSSSTGPLSSSHQRWYPYANGAALPWGLETDQVNNRYIQFTCSPKSGYSFTVKNLSASLAAGGSSTGVRANAYYSNNDTNFSSMIKLNSNEMILHQGSYNPTDTFITYPLNVKVDNGNMFYFRIYPWYNSTSSTTKYIYIQNVVITGTATAATGIDVKKTFPVEFSLEQNYPNPFNPSTRIFFGLDKSSNVKLSVYNMMGQEVASIVNGFLNAGQYETSFKADNLPTGIYIYSLITPTQRLSKKMLMIK